MSHSIAQQVADELGVALAKVTATISMIDEGNTVPFIARYRKEVTGGLDDTQLRTLDSRLTYLRGLDERRQSILNSINEQGKLTPELKKMLLDADSKTRLEDLYLPYKPKRRTKGQVAIEQGLEPLAKLLWNQGRAFSSPIKPAQEAQAFLKGEVADVDAALEGARSIVVEWIAEDATLLHTLRTHLMKHAQLSSKLVKSKAKEPQAEKYKDYFEHNEAINRVPSHRALAMLRGKNEGILQLSINADPHQPTTQPPKCIDMISRHFDLYLQNHEADKWRAATIESAWKTKLSTQLNTELMNGLKERSEIEAIEVFASNLKDLLMAAPAGEKPTLGFDPGLRTGSKLAVVDNTGKVLATKTIYPHAPHNKIAESAKTLVDLIKRYDVQLIAIGNGTASRESDEFVGKVIKEHGLSAQKLIVSEAGASVYSASELAAKEFPDLDVSLRGAVSIARRLQDPLAELVKIDPKSIGVGQYQHDVNQSQLAKRLDAIVEDCVNAVGVDLNMASAPLLARVSGLSESMAQNIVAYRDEQGRFDSRAQIKKVPRLGPKAFEQCAGFLRIVNGKNPLDASAVHPEAYPVVKQISEKTKMPIEKLIGDSEFLNKLMPEHYTNEVFGVPTVTDIIRELDKPGRDPRPEFKTASFAVGVNTINDLEVGMRLEGVVSNVANFGAFVDIGVHQDGLVHISALADRYVDDPRDIVKAGDIVKVTVMEVDVARKRIALSMKDVSASSGTPKNATSKNDTSKTNAAKPVSNERNSQQTGSTQSAFAAAFAAAKTNK